MAERVRAALASPAVLVLLLCMLLGLSAFSGRSETDSTALERRIGGLLSGVYGAGDVQVVIRTRTVQQELSTGGREAQEMPCGAVALIDGGGDPLVRMQLINALCALLGLDASQVEVIEANTGRGTVR